MSPILITLISLFCITYYLWIQYKRTRTNEPPSVPLLESIRIMFKNTDLWSKVLLILKLVHEKGGVCSGYYYDRGVRRIYPVTDPEDALTALKACGEKASLYDLWRPWLGAGSFLGNAQVNKLHNKTFMFRSMMPDNLEAFLKYFNIHAEKSVRTLSSRVSQGPFDVTRFLKVYNLEQFFETSLAFDDRKNVDVNQYLDAVSEFIHIAAYRFNSMIFQHDFFFNWTNLKKRQDALLKVLHHTSDEIIRQRRQKLKDIREKKFEPPGHVYLIDLLLEGVENGTISEEALRADVDGAIFAGHDTSAYSQLFALVLLGSYPEVQERAFQEIQSILGERTEVTKSDLSKLVYLEAIIKESMRVYPFVACLPRRLDRNLKLKNCTLPSGCTVAVFVWGVHRHECWGPDTDVFRPERWLEPHQLPKATVILSFAEGARVCKGRTYAMMSMKTLLAYLIRNFRFKADHTKMKLECLGVLEPISGHHIAIEKRI